MIARAAAIVAVCASCGGGQSEHGSRGHSGDEIEEIHKVVFEARRAGQMRTDLTKYMSQWTDDARIIVARSEQPSELDWILDRTQIEATRKLQFKDPSVARAVEFRNPRVTFEGEVATLRVDVHVGYPDATELVSEIYKLRRTDDGWRVFENRWWWISSMAYGETTTYDAEHWAALDVRVDAERPDADLYELGVALMDASRFPEAHDVFVKVTEGEDPEPHDWFLRGQTALMIGNADDALASFRTVLELDPRASVPNFAR